MSKGLMTPGVVGPNYWSYMAAVIQGRLEQIATTRKVESKAIPKGVLNGAKEFFMLLMPTVKGDPLKAENLFASMNAYDIAVMTAEQAFPNDSNHPVVVRNRLELYASFLNRLEESRALSNEEVKTAGELARFFQALHQLGDDESLRQREEDSSWEEYQRHRSQELLRQLSRR